MQQANLGVGAVGGGGAVRHRANPAVQGGDVWRVFAQVPDLVNGNANDFGFIFVSAGLADAYHWVPDAFFGADNDADTEAHMRALVVNEATIYSARLAGAGMTDLKRRTIALMVAIGRRVIRRAWGVADVDIVNTQLARLDHAAGVAATVTYAGVLSHEIPGVATVAEYANERAEVEGAWAGPLDLFLAKVARCALGMPAANGVTLVETLVHHYQEPHKMVCDTILAQHMTVNPTLPPGVVLDDVKDAICHKTAHPIRSAVLVGLARSPAVRERLARIGEGAATVRLPALFAPEKAAHAIQALVYRASQAGVSSNVAIATATVDALVTATTLAITNAPGHAGVLAAAEVVNAFKLANGLHIAWCAGFYASICDESQAGARSRSVINAKSVQTITAEYQVGYTEGYNHYGNAVRYRRAQAKAGFLVGFGLMGAAKPDDWAPPAEAN